MGSNRACLRKKRCREEVELWQEMIKITEKNYPGINNPQKKYYAISHLIGYLILDLVNETEKNISRFKIETLEDVRNAKARLVAFSSGYRKKKSTVEGFSGK